MDQFVSPFTNGQIISGTFQGQESSPDGGLIFLTDGDKCFYVMVEFPGANSPFSIVAGPTMGKSYSLAILDNSTAIAVAAIQVNIS